VQLVERLALMVLVVVGVPVTAFYFEDWWEKVQLLVEIEPLMALHLQRAYER
jgi:hypothetical protein